MIKSALERGDIKPGDKLVEATSGNTGIALAMIAQVMGVHMTLIMPDNSTKERVLSMEAYGAKVILTPAAKTIEYSRELAEEMSAKEGYFMLNQFANEDNWKGHYRTTGPEIWNDTGGKVTHFVSAMGTTGTIMGVSRYLKEKNATIQIVGTQPTDGSSIPGIRRWSPEFLPKIFEPTRVDRVVDVSQDDATQMTRRMAREEGIMAGMSSGGALYAALKVAEGLESGVIVCITCDRGDRYLSSDLFG
jgi:cysteine synthase B